MELRMLLDLAQKRYSDDWGIFKSLPGLLTTNATDLAQLINQYVYRNKSFSSMGLIDKYSIAQIAEEFHSKAGTLTDGVEHNINLFKRGNPTIRIAHTPDHFSYFAVYAQFIYLNVVAHALSNKHNIIPAQIFLIVDFDVIEDKHHRVSYFPDVDRNDGVFRLSAPINSDSLNQVQYSICKPSESSIQDWINSLKKYIEYNLKILYRSGFSYGERKVLFARLNAIEAEIWEAHNRSSDLVEFDSIFMSRLINLYWRIPIAFFPLSQTASLFRECYEYLLQLYPKMVDISCQVVDNLQTKGLFVGNSLRLDKTTFPFWLICEKCSYRIPLKIISENPLIVEGHCDECNIYFQRNFGSFNSPNIGQVDGKLLPRVLFDSLTDIVGWEVSGGVGYEGSSEHVITNSLIASKLGLQIPPECLWRPRGIYYGLTELRAAQLLPRLDNSSTSDRVYKALKRVYFGRSSILYFLLSQGFNGLHNMWNLYFESGGEINRINIGKKPSPILENQDLLLRDCMMGFD